MLVYLIALNAIIKYKAKQFIQRYFFYVIINSSDTIAKKCECKLFEDHQ